MKNRHVAAFETMLARRRRIGRSLNATLLSQRAEHAALAQQAMQTRSLADARKRELESHDARIDTLTSRTGGFDIRELEHCHQYRTVLAEQHSQLEAELRKAMAAQTDKEAQMAQTRRQILKNDAQIEVYVKRIDALHAAQARAEEDALEDELADARPPGPDTPFQSSVAQPL